MTTLAEEATSATTLRERYCIVGAGPAGLIAARAFKRAGIEFDIVEKYHEVGGIWNIDAPGTPMYETCNFIASKKRGGFIGYPMPEHYPDFPTWQQIRDYIHQMARDYGLLESVEFNRQVVAAQPVETENGTYWQVVLDSGETRDYRGVIYAGGHEWKSYLPEIEGQDTFTGRLIHSRDYRSLAELSDQRVLVVGAGNSGVDIASDAALVGRRAWLSTRRGYWFLPKQVFGVPTPDFIDGTEPVPGIAAVQGLSEEQRIDLILSVVGDITRFGLPAPDHLLTATHPIVSNTVLHNFTHGKLQHRPDVRGIHGSTVTFVDGRSEEVDVIVLATGYDIDIPWLQPGLVNYRSGRPVTHLSTFFPGLDNFYAVGIMHAADNGYQNFDEFAQLIVSDIRATLTGANAEAVHALKHDYDPDLRGDFPFVKTRRNENQYNAPLMRQMLAEVQQKFAIVIPRWDDQEFYRTQLVAPVTPEGVTPDAEASSDLTDEFHSHNEKVGVLA